MAVRMQGKGALCCQGLSGHWQWNKALQRCSLVSLVHLKLQQFWHSWTDFRLQPSTLTASKLRHSVAYLQWTLLQMFSHLLLPEDRHINFLQDLTEAVQRILYDRAHLVIPSTSN